MFENVNHLDGGLSWRTSLTHIMYYQKNLVRPIYLLIALFLIHSALNETAKGQVSLPLKSGQLVLTCFSGTSNNAVIPDPNNYVVAVFDTRDPLGNGAALGSNWAPPPGFVFHNEGSTDEWLASNLGEVFGVTLDGETNPNIFVAATTVYGNFPPGPAGYGGVYKLDATTGTISSTSIPGTGNASLGSMCHADSLDGGSWIYVSNFEDGNIYRIDAATLTVQPSNYDHGISGRLAQSLPPIADPGSPDTLSPLGRRVWGVQVHEGRLYYAVWVEDKTNPSAVDANEIWSVGLDVTTGDFLSTTAILEATLPVKSGVWSLPVASIDFSSSGAMLLAERYYRWSGVHEARVLEFTGGSGAWTASPVNKYRIGDSTDLTAGGVVSDCEENVWSTGDILHGNIYGLQRVPVGGNASDTPATANSVLIDVDGDTVNQDKTLIGAIDMLNDCECLIVDNVKVDCPREEGAPFTVSLDLTNQSDQTASWVLFTPVSGLTGVHPNQLPLSPGLPDGETLTLPGLELVGGREGETVCFNVTLMSLENGQLVECCTQKVEIELPYCECVALETASVRCGPISAEGTTEVEVCVEVTNLGTVDLHHVFVLADPAAGLTAVPNYIVLSPPLAPGATETICVRVDGAVPGTELKLPLTFHNEGLEECCLRTLCVDVPEKNGGDDPGFCCRLPEVVYCCPQFGMAKALIVLCNKGSEARELEWKIDVPAPTLACPVVLDPATDFLPNHGVVVVPPGACREFVVDIDCEKLLQGNLGCARFGLTVVDTNTGRRTYCESRVERSDDPTLKHVGPDSADDVLVPGVVDVSVGGRGVVRLEAENLSDVIFEGELQAVGESGVLQFGDGDGVWRRQVRLPSGSTRPFNVAFSLDLSDPERLAAVRAQGVTMMHLYWVFPDRPTRLAASVPIRIEGELVAASARMISLRRVASGESTAMVALECDVSGMSHLRLEACQSLDSSEWKSMAFAVAPGEALRESLTVPTAGRMTLWVPMSDDVCFFRVTGDTLPVTQ